MKRAGRTQVFITEEGTRLERERAFFTDEPSACSKESGQPNKLIANENEAAGGLEQNEMSPRATT